MVSAKEFEDYNAIVASINKELSQIAIKVESLAQARTAHTSNSEFIGLMTRHKQLTDNAAKLHQDMLKKLVIRT